MQRRHFAKAFLVVSLPLCLQPCRGQAASSGETINYYNCHASTHTVSGITESITPVFPAPANDREKVLTAFRQYAQSHSMGYFDSCDKETTSDEATDDREMEINKVRNLMHQTIVEIGWVYEWTPQPAPPAPVDKTPPPSSEAPDRTKPVSQNAPLPKPVEKTAPVKPAPIAPAASPAKPPAHFYVCASNQIGVGHQAYISDAFAVAKQDSPPIQAEYLLFLQKKYAYPSRDTACFDGYTTLEAAQDARQKRIEQFGNIHDPVIETHWKFSGALPIN
jgi:hypothetical protein